MLSKGLRRKILGKSVMLGTKGAGLRKGRRPFVCVGRKGRLLEGYKRGVCFSANKKGSGMISGCSCGKGFLVARREVGGVNRVGGGKRKVRGKWSLPIQAP